MYGGAVAPQYMYESQKTTFGSLFSPYTMRTGRSHTLVTGLAATLPSHCWPEVLFPSLICALRVPCLSAFLL